MISDPVVEEISQVLNDFNTEELRQIWLADKGIDKIKISKQFELLIKSIKSITKSASSEDMITSVIKYQVIITELNKIK